MTHHLYPTPPFSPQGESHVLYPPVNSASYTSTSTPYSTVTYDDSNYFGDCTNPAAAPVPNRLREESAVQTLDSLVSFYHQGRMWIYHTRESLYNEAPSSGAREGEVKMEAEEEGTLTSMYGASRTSLRSATQPPVQSRRKGKNLHLDSLPIPQTKPSSGEARNRVEILDMFERMMTSRMESCERVNRLVRNASGYV